ncbi:hypothetical protein SYNPS1DRAFT_27643 [Syncephalis pseudoplumigaleata]|uniref:HIT-type domain-containing protein n=1 Tax=Syncephalis pseudoplumigaleata TaxID=1712513 RepID=A0A4P9Z2T5_9FUNG|nr:hypothetical protein SYNPS1DRAFT_27643 [Syncephalis pseudoplumigaleata]|eukprot:RKP26678.1 hypothetical protein SYNPS1DRAFT_27643 [Syncephalis pseudoplumigaleata]
MTKRRRVAHAGAEKPAGPSGDQQKPANTCQVCMEAEAKYKCPTCYLPFNGARAPYATTHRCHVLLFSCSVVCSRKHKDTSTSIQRQLQHSRLKATIQRILRCPRIAEQDAVLDELLASDADFRAFARELLTTVGYEDADANRALQMTQALQRQRIQAALQQAATAQSDEE